MQLGDLKALRNNDKSLKRLAMHLVGQLPDDEADARLILHYMGRLYEDFIVEKRQRLFSVSKKVSGEGASTVESDAKITPLRICGAG